jgi:hypothetical protein
MLLLTSYPQTFWGIGNMGCVPSSQHICKQHHCHTMPEAGCRVEQGGRMKASQGMVHGSLLSVWAARLAGLEWVTSAVPCSQPCTL